MAFEHYIRSDGKNLRLGYTTGTCAALAAACATEALLTGSFPQYVHMMTPRGIEVMAKPECCETDRETSPAEPGAEKKVICARCGVRKDAGDDADVTDGLLIMAQAQRRELLDRKPLPAGKEEEPDEDSGQRGGFGSGERVQILGGKGIGRVTRPGLDQKVGEAAINRVPREMIRQQVLRVCEEQGYEGGITITIFAPQGEAAAAKTLNGRLGIEGGISIIGTSGIVEPMSMKAYADSVRLVIRQAAQLRCGEDSRNSSPGQEKPRLGTIVLTPGNYGLSFLKQHGYAPSKVPVVVCSNFIGEAVDEAAACGFDRILLVGHVGKLVKLAAGIMNTHSSMADGRAEIFTAHAAIAGASPEICRKLMEAVTTDACIAILKEAGLAGEVLYSIREKALASLRRRCAGADCDIIIFSNEYGELGSEKNV